MGAQRDQKRSFGAFYLARPPGHASDAVGGAVRVAPDGRRSGSGLGALAPRPPRGDSALSQCLTHAREHDLSRFVALPDRV